MRQAVTAIAGAAMFLPLCAPARSQQIPTFNAASRLVEFTVVVEGQHGPVSSLTEDDFRVTDNGKVQTIRVFEANAAAQKRTSASAALPPGQFSNVSADAMSRANPAIILLDCLNSTTRISADPLHPAFDSGHACKSGKEEIAKFIGQLGPDDSVALWGLNAYELAVLSDFSGDKQQLLAALRKFQPYDVPAAAAPAVRFLARGATKASDKFDEWVAYEQHLANANFTLTAMRAIASHLAQIPGRISPIWVTAAPCISGAKIAVALGNGRIAVYPVDARGLVTRGRILQGSEQIGPPPHDAFTRFVACSQSTWQPPGQDNLRDIAAETGGVAYLNRNDLASGIRQAVEDSGESYTLGFYVGDRALDNQFHRLRVSVKVRGLRTRYPSGYWALRDTAAQSGVNPMLAALVSPVDAEAVPITAHVAHAAGGRLIIRGAVGLAGLALRQTGGLRQGRFMVALVGQTVGGAVAQRMSNVLEVRLNDRQYADARRNGLVFHQLLTPAAGVVTIRILAEDLTTGNVGSLIVPLSSVH